VTGQHHMEYDIFLNCQTNDNIEEFGTNTFGGTNE